MASRLIVLDTRGKLPLVFILIVPEGILILGIAGAEYHDLGERIHDLRDAGIYQIETFLVRQSGDESDNKLVLVLLKAKLLLQGQLVLLLFGNHIFVAVRRSNVLVF